MSAPKSFLVRCPACGTRNRVPEDRVGDRPKCGKCATHMDLHNALTGRPVVVTDETFDKEVLNAPLPVLLDCWAPWCGPCRMVAPILDELAASWRGRVKVAKLNTDENQRTATRFQVQSIPTLLLFDQGRVVETIVGALPRAELERRLSPFLA